jgi:VWFA-related protein
MGYPIHSTLIQLKRISKSLPSIVLVFFLGISQAIASRQAQLTPPTRSSERTANDSPEDEVRTVFVSVVDNKGNPIIDLRPEEFEVKEDHNSQQILEAKIANSTPLLIGILVDMSGSESSPRERAKNLQSLSDFLTSTLRDSDQAFVAGFGVKPKGFSPITGNVANLQAGLKRIAEIDPFGGTAIYDSLVEVAATMSSDTTAHKVIVVLSDFQDNSSTLSPETTRERLQQHQVAVFSLLDATKVLKGRVMKNATKEALITSSKSGGICYTFQSPSELQGELNQLHSVLTSFYLLKYRSTGAPKRNHLVDVKIQVSRKGAVVMASPSRPDIP